MNDWDCVWFCKEGEGDGNGSLTRGKPDTQVHLSAHLVCLEVTVTCKM